MTGVSAMKAKAFVGLMALRQRTLTRVSTTTDAR